MSASHSTKSTPTVQLPTWKRMPWETKISTTVLTWLYVLDFAEGTPETGAEIARALNRPANDVQRAIASFVDVTHEMKYVKYLGVRRLVCCVEGEVQQAPAVEVPECEAWLREYLLLPDFYPLLKVVDKGSVMHRINPIHRQEAVLGCLLQTPAAMERLAGIIDREARADFVSDCIAVIVKLPHTPGSYQRCDAAMLARQFRMEVPEILAASSSC